MNTSVETVIVGGGQAGLATAHHLLRQGRECLVLEANQRVGDGWRQQWDSLRLYSPAKFDGLPGMPFPASAWHFPTKDETADFLEAYATQLGLPVRLGTRVLHVAADDGGFRVDTDEGTFDADNVVVATGTFGRTPYVPDFAAGLDPATTQLHSSQYRRPAQLPEGRVLVVGASHSGQDIALELARERQVVLAGRDCGEIPVPLESRRMRALFPLIWFIWGRVLNRGTPIGRKELRKIRLHGGPALRVKRADLRAAGVERTTERVVGVHDGRPVLGDDRVLEVSTVIWATGFRQQFDWIEPDVVGEEGWPREERGEVAEVPGLFFCGLSFQSSFRSMLLGGVGEDAAHVARRITERASLSVRA
ncbi:NAD(P)/FAD-dependent oxidoreductase [Tessaracoccus sp. OS52]|uniref:flavin-containing monooxygenase n=1 Tax=Tessaracoccus sp. OS52 TaxID=2886691 RepID=UPI001D102A25|nr:FAD-dependent oxidoreductase [Tessaracoccus sp. OS52]MCC2594359.1 NAD(P)/FAD-dependent oxidoreductase [Tessaracoccus sp. OS52]